MRNDKSFLAETRAGYETELIENVVPFWMRHGVDRINGGFFTCLEQDGSVYDTFKQMWMQWRAVWTFAALCGTRFKRPEYLECAERGFDFLIANGRRPDGSWHYMLTADGRPMADHDAGAEIFSASFAALACAALFNVTGRAEYLAEAQRSLDIYQRDIAAAEQASPELPGYVPRKKLAYRMILLNVLNELGKTAGGKKFAEKSTAVIEEMKRFEMPGKGIVFENIGPDNSFDLNSQDGRFTNPGHALEGMWFIMDHCRTAGSAAANDELEFALRCTRATLNYGWDTVSGGILYFKDFLGKPLSRNDCMLKAWWPQNEAALAALYAYEATGDEFFSGCFQKIVEYAWKNLRDGATGEWFAYGPVDGRRVHSYKGSRWKGFFHLPRFLMKSIEVLERLEKRAQKS